MLLDELSLTVNMEKVKALIDLSKLSFARYDERRKYHWQISIAFWALIVGAIIYKNSLKLPLSSSPLLLIFFAFLYLFCWLRTIWVAGENDKRLATYYRDEASSILHNEKHMPTHPAKISFKSSKRLWALGFLNDGGTWQHIIVTVILFLYLYYYHTSKS